MPATVAVRHAAGTRPKESIWYPSTSEHPMEMGYVLKDVFNARMDRMELMLERNLLKHESLSNEIKARMDQMDQHMDQMDKRIDQMEKRMDKMDGRMDKMDGRIDRIEGNISDMKGDIKALNSGFATLQNRLALNLAWMGIIIGLVLAIAQHFWK